MLTDIKKRALHRSKIIEGQVRGLQNSIDSEQYCVDIITQSLAIQKSLASLNKLIVENHLRTHVSHMMKSDDEGQNAKAIEEMLKVFEISSIRQTR